MHKPRDEHDPLFNPSEIWEEEIPSPIWAVVGGIAMALVFALLAGCDSSELDRLEAAAEHRDRIARACFPEEGQRIVVVRENSAIHFTYIDIGPGRYSRTFPHVEVRVATIEDGS